MPILFVDDDVIVRELYSRFAEMVKLDCMVAEDGFDALDIIANNNIEAVVTDITMPDMDGIELATIIRKDLPNMPVFAYTGGCEVSDDKLKMIFDDVYKKPMNMSQLMAEMIKFVVERDKAEEEQA